MILLSLNRSLQTLKAPLRRRLHLLLRDLLLLEASWSGLALVTEALGGPRTNKNQASKALPAGTRLQHRFRALSSTWIAMRAVSSYTWRGGIGSRDSPYTNLCLSSSSLSIAGLAFASSVNSLKSFHELLLVIAKHLPSLRLELSSLIFFLSLSLRFSSAPYAECLAHDL